jgi:hypothetical protein
MTRHPSPNAPKTWAEQSRRRIGKRPATRAKVLFGLCWLAGSLVQAQAQHVLPLVDLFTHAWRYDDSGRDLGTVWRTNNFNDAAWPMGRGLFGVETAAPFPYAPAGFPAIDVPLALTPPASNSQTITYYFRTHFNMPTGSLTGVVLQATNFLDDGAVFYLNGLEAGRFRVPSNHNFQTVAAVPASEGQPEVTNLLTSPLRVGDNLLAVEVHQSGPLSADVAFAMSLTARVPEPLVVARSPQSRTNVVGTSAIFNVEVNGGPVDYQWFKDGSLIVGAQTDTFLIPQVQFSHGGRYSVRLSNAISSVVSDESILTVVPDTFGPKLISAIVSETGMTNRIVITFSEKLLASTATNLAHYRVTRRANDADVALSNAAYNPTAAQVQLAVSGPEWRIGDSYYLTVNGVRDLIASNVIAPDSRIGIGWPQVTRVLNTDHPWNFHTAAVFDPDVFTTSWWLPDYQPGPWWAQGVGLFCGGAVAGASCFGEFRTEIGFQYEPSLFRTAFQWPAQLSSSARLRVGLAADDGVVLYLNGAELFRTNVSAGPIHASTLAPVALVSPMCATQTVFISNLLAGTNWLAAAVCQAVLPGGDTAFGLVLDAVYERTGSVPSNPPAELRLTALESNFIQISWVGSGFALESSPTLDDNNSAPLGPWTEVPDMTNPYTTRASDSQRFYRLK